MTNKNMRTNLKQNRYKLAAAILAATTVIAAATPAFASEEIPENVAEMTADESAVEITVNDDSDFEFAFDLEEDAEADEMDMIESDVAEDETDLVMVDDEAPVEAAGNELTEDETLVDAAVHEADDEMSASVNAAVAETEKALLAVETKEAENLNLNMQLDYGNYSFQCEEINGTMAYPDVSTDGSRIEYRDRDGNLLGTRAITKDVYVAPNDIKKGCTYVLKKGGIYSWFGGEDNITVKVEKYVGGRGCNVFASKVNADGSLQKPENYGLNWNLPWNAYETKVGDLKVC